MGIIKHSTGIVQRQAPRSNGWTKARRALFLDELATSGNATRAAKAVGMHPESAHRLRRRDPQFAGLWMAASALAAERLQEEMVAFSLGQVQSEDNPDDERAEAEQRPFDPQVAHATLKMLADFPSRKRSYKPRATNAATIEATLMKRLDALDRRLAKEKAGKAKER